MESSIQRCAMTKRKDDCISLIFWCEYKMDLPTIKVNGFDVPEPMLEAPAGGDIYFLPHPISSGMYTYTVWDGSATDIERLSRNICHTTKEAAIIHAKAMLGIDPYEG